VAVKKIKLGLVDTSDYEKVSWFTFICKLKTSFTSVEGMHSYFGTDAVALFPFLLCTSAFLQVLFMYLSYIAIKFHAE